MDDELKNFLVEYLSDNNSYFTYFDRDYSKPYTSFVEQEILNMYLTSIMVIYFSNSTIKSIKNSIAFLEKNKPENVETLCKTIVYYCPHWLKHIPEEHQTQELCMYTISRFHRNFKDPINKATKQIKNPTMRAFIKLISIGVKNGPNAVYE